MLTNSLVKKNHEATLPSKSLPFIVEGNDANRKCHSKLNRKNSLHNPLVI